VAIPATAAVFATDDECACPDSPPNCELAYGCAEGSQRDPNACACEPDGGGGSGSGSGSGSCDG